MPKIPDGELSNKQARFCEEYLIDLNGTQAAIRAGYSQHSAGAIGNENLGDEKFEPAGANKSLELLGKHLGLFTEKLQVTGDGGGPVRWEVRGIESDAG